MSEGGNESKEGVTGKKTRRYWDGHYHENIPASYYDALQAKNSPRLAHIDSEGEMTDSEWNNWLERIIDNLRQRDE